MIISEVSGLQMFTKFGSDDLLHDLTAYPIARMR